ncbi:MAG: hypothetical protein IH899_19505 [Planctomycetes bacterium]|nr:hypothetical protein [Planctomycetota bacterium]
METHESTSSVSIAFHVVSYATTLPVDFQVIAEVGCYAERDEHPKAVDHIVHSESGCDAAWAAIMELSSRAVQPRELEGHAI